MKPFFRLNSSQASNVSSCASEETRQAPLKYRLSKINEALEILNITEIPENKSEDQEYVKKKIDEIGENIRTKLKMEKSEVSVEDKVLQQFTDQFKHLSKTDQYRVMTSMPKVLV